MIQDLILSECKMTNLCIDCNNDRCWLRGKKESDCPKWICDNPTHDCESGCEFIDRFISGMRIDKKREKL